MKRLFILFTILGCSFFQGQAQKKLRATEKISEPAKFKASKLDDVYQTKDGGFWSLSHNLFNSYITLFDESMNKVDGDFLTFEYGGQKLKFEDLKEFQGRYIVFLSFTNIQHKKKYLFYTELEPEEMKTTSSCVKISELNMGTKQTTYASYDIRLSRDKQSMIVLGILPTKLKDGYKRTLVETPSSTPIIDSLNLDPGYIKFSFWVLDKDLKIVNYRRKHEIVLDDENDKFYFTDFVLNDDGTVYLLGKNDLVNQYLRLHEEKHDRAFSEHDRSAFVVEQIRPNGDIYQFTTPPGTLYNDMGIVINKKGQINLIGLVAHQYKNIILTSGIERYLLSRDQLEILLYTSEQFDSEVLDIVNNVEDDKSSSSEDEDLSYLLEDHALELNTIVYLNLDENENPIAVLEERYTKVVVRTRFSDGYTVSYNVNYFYYGDMVFMRFNDDKIDQAGFNKRIASKNNRVEFPIDVSYDDKYLTAVAQDVIIRVDADMSEVRSHSIVGIKSDKKKKLRVPLRKLLNEDEVLIAQQVGKKVTWIRTTVR